MALSFDSKVDVAPKVFSHSQAFADYDLPAEILRLFCARRLVLFGWFVGSA